MDHINATLSATFDDDAVFDLLRGLAALTGSPIVGDLARLVGAAPRADLSIAFNHKQIGSKFWLRDALVEAKAIVNGLPILEGREAQTLAPWYTENVMGGPGSFVLPAEGFGDFGRAIRQKFVIEISGRGVLPPSRS